MKGNVFSIERYAVHDGGGIRTIVYLKGCPLRCLWCANPEGQESRSQLFFFPDRCIGCGRCVAACKHEAARRNDDGSISFDPAFCRGCGECVETCYANARQLFGREMSVDEVMAAILKDQAFYRKSGGGVTLSGGEPTMQAEFVTELLGECRRRGINTAIETSGYTTWPRLAAIAEHLDLALYDIKHMDSAEHRRLTGVGNELILDNLVRLGEKSVLIVVRVPVIPGFNDGVANMAALGHFLAGNPAVRHVELLPYHNYGSGKYERCGWEYALADLEPPEKEHLQEMAAVIERHNVRCLVQ